MIVDAERDIDAISKDMDELFSTFAERNLKGELGDDDWEEVKNDGL